MRTLAFAVTALFLVPALASASDAEFVESAAHAGMVEIELGNHAAKHAKNGDVQKFARRMVDDHGKANRELDSLARSEGFMVPQQMGAAQREKVERLEKLEGLDFDRAYMRAMLDDHVAAIESFRTQAKREGPVAEWAETKIPILEAHLALARKVALQLGIQTPEN